MKRKFEKSGKTSRVKISPFRQTFDNVDLEEMFESVLAKTKLE